MKPRTLIFLCIIFLVLLTLVFLKQKMLSSVPTAETLEDMITVPVDVQDVTDCVMRLGDKEIHLAKGQDRWVLQSHYAAPVDEQRFKEFMDKLDALKGEMRSNNPEILGDYGIAENDQPVHILLKRGTQQLAHLVVGTKKMDRGWNFIRAEGSHKVYVVEQDILSDLGFWREVKPELLDFNRWTDKHIGQFETGKVSAIAMVEGSGASAKKAVDLSRRTTDGNRTWETAQNYSFELSADKIQQFLSTLSGTVARSVIAAQEAGDFSSAVWTLQLSLEDGRPYTLVSSGQDKDGSNYYVKEKEAQYAFLVPSYTFKTSLRKTDGDFFVSNPLKILEDDINTIEIQDKEKKENYRLTREEKKEDEAESEVIWTSAKGQKFSKDKVGALLRQIQQMTLKTLSGPRQSAADMLFFRIASGQGPKELTFSKSVLSGHDQECHYLHIKDDARLYCVAPHEVSALTNALAGLKEDQDNER